MKSINAMAQQAVNTETQQLKHSGAAESARKPVSVLETSTFQTKRDRILEFCMSNLLPVMMEYWREFTNKYPDESLQRFVMGEYAKQITLKGVTNTAQIKAGMLKATQQKYRPNPTEFAKLCLPTPEELGLKDTPSALAELITRRSKYRGQDFTYSHRVLEVVDERIGYRMYEKGMKESDFAALFAGEYEYWVNRFMNGDLPPARKALPYVPNHKARIEQYIEQHGPIVQGDDSLSLRMKALGEKVKKRFISNHDDTEGKVA